MDGLHRTIDEFLASTLRGDETLWPEATQAEALRSKLIERIEFHGIAGLLFHQCRGVDAWPADVRVSLHSAAVAQTMWEIRHKVVLEKLLTALANGSVLAIILKGTALAYDVYDAPATRARGDTDLLIERADLARARTCLNQCGFRAISKSVSDHVKLQEVWQLTTEDGALHEIDLHWGLVNSHALQNTLTFADCVAGMQPLPRLSRGAHVMDRGTALIHACIHRAQHMVSPYFVDGAAYYEGDRLIWANDAQLLAASLTSEDWKQLCDLALRRGLAAICLEGLLSTRKWLGTLIPDEVVASLQSAPQKTVAANYLLRSGQAGRAWMDLRAVRGLPRKLAYLTTRILPSASFMRAKYQDMADRPLAVLYLRRVAELWQRRDGSGEG